MGRVIPMRDDHGETQDLLPWYITGRLDAAERAHVDAHLAGCADCRDHLAVEKRLEAELSALDPAAEEGLRRFWSRVEPAPAARVVPPARRFGRRTAAPWLALAAAVQLVVLMGVGALAPWRGKAPEYRTLGAAATPVAGNLMVIFRPSTPERDLRAALVSTGAQVVGGPTAADAYILQVPGAARTRALAALKARADVEDVQPIDADAAR